MVLVLALTALATAGKCDKLDGDEEVACVRDETRADLEKQIKAIGKCKQDAIAEQAKCLQDRADLTQQIADLYAAAVPEPKRRAKPKAQRSNSNRMEIDVNEE